MSAPRRVRVEALLRALGIKATLSPDRRKWVAPCPDPAHDDHSPSWSIVADGESRAASMFCFSCGFSGGPWELAAAVLGLDLQEAGRWISDLARGSASTDLLDDEPILRVVLPDPERLGGMTLPEGVLQPSVDGSPWNPRALSYLLGRGLTQDQIDRWALGYATRGRLAWRVVVPVVTGGRLLSYVARSLFDDGRPRYDAARRSDPGARPDAALWGEPAFDSEVRVATVTEGVFKGLAMERAGAPNPCAVLGASNLGPEKLALLARHDALLVATDPDPAGDLAFEEIADGVVRYSEPVRVRLARSPDDATEEENRAAWREALRVAAPGLRERRASHARFHVHPGGRGV